MKRMAQLLGGVVILIMLFTACRPVVTPEPTVTSAQPEPYRITGSFDYSAVDYVLETRWLEHAVALVDMYGFVTRNEDWEIPVTSQYLGFLAVDNEANTATYDLFLPEEPAATLADVDNNGVTDTGVQIFTVAYWPNTYGGVYSEGDDRSSGWPSFLASVKTDEQKQYEVTGGKLVVWAPDALQSFPSGFGADGKLFTADDPAAPIPAGWTIVDLDQTPFAFTQEAESDLALYQPEYVAEKDYSTLSYTEAFDQLYTFISQKYAFNGIEGKAPDWDTLYNEIKPRIEQAEASQDADAFYFALQDFTYAFKDGHVNMSQTDAWLAAFTEATSGGYGFSIRELDDGRFVVIYLTAGGPAETAGVQVGAEVTAFNDKPISEAVAEVIPWTLPASLETSIRYQQARYLLRTLPDTEATVTFTNPSSASQTVTLKAIAERDSFARTSVYYGVDTTKFLLPIDFKILDSGVGYIGIRSNEDDVNLMIKLFERALKTFRDAEVPGVIIDMRYNSGGMPLGLATFLTDQNIPMGQSYYYSEASGQFEPEGTPSVWEPMLEQYGFDKMALLVGPGCVSACEEESYGFSQVPDMIVVGMFPTAGAFGEVSRGQVVMPDGIYMQFPLGRYVLPDGSLFLEGKGVQPNFWVPKTLETVSSTEDVVLQYAERAILLPLGAGITPSAPPKLLNENETQTALSSASMLEDKAREKYTTADMLVMDKTFTFTIPLSRSETLVWAWGWCARDQATLEDNLGKMDVGFTLNGEVVALDQFLKLDYDSDDGQKCTAYVLGLKDWKGSEHKLITTVTITAALNDGVYDFAPGYQIFEYKVYVKP